MQSSSGPTTPLRGFDEDLNAVLEADHDAAVPRPRATSLGALNRPRLRPRQFSGPSVLPLFQKIV